MGDELLAMRFESGKVQNSSSNFAAGSEHTKRGIQSEDAEAELFE